MPTATTSRSPATEGRADSRQAGARGGPKSVAQKPQPAAARPKGLARRPTKPAASKQVAAAPPKPQKQLVPVTQVSLPNAPADAAAIGTVIRRLPPVDPADTGTIDRQRRDCAGWLHSHLSDDGN